MTVESDPKDSDPKDSQSRDGGGKSGPIMKLQLDVIGTYEAVVAARGKMLAWLELGGATEQAVSEMALVITEICNNAVEHGSATLEEPMRLTAGLQNGILNLEVIELSGDSVDPISQALLESFGEPSLDDERGRGLFLIRIYVDELQIETTDNNKLRIVIKKKVAP
ncbi:MAG: ATP-binding protein [Planctomycetes bacterium]|nr:ATP-binding protein [Planctomycetota bacterium]